MGRPMPPEIRAGLRAVHHPARAVPCPHCGAAEHRPCRAPSRRRLMRDPHPSRVTAWTVSTRSCPTCGAPAGEDCRAGDRPMTDTHPARTEETTR